MIFERKFGQASVPGAIDLANEVKNLREASILG